MTQATNNRILLRTLAFCVAIAGIGATPTMASCNFMKDDYYQCRDLERRLNGLEMKQRQLERQIQIDEDNRQFRELSDQGYL